MQSRAFIERLALAELTGSCAEAGESGIPTRQPRRVITIRRNPSRDVEIPDVETLLQVGPHSGSHSTARTVTPEVYRVAAVPQPSSFPSPLCDRHLSGTQDSRVEILMRVGPPPPQLLGPPNLRHDIRFTVSSSANTPGT